MAVFKCHLVCVAVFLLVELWTAAAVRPVVMPPIKNSTTEAALIIVPGASIPGTAYRPLANVIQNTSSLKLWIVLLTDFIFGMPNPIELISGIKNSISVLRDHNMQSNNTFLAGHSLGGVFVGMEGSTFTSELKGILLFASYLTRQRSLATYPLPVLHISGDLDGQTRITRIADTFQELEQDVIKDNSSMLRTPVVIMRGVSHAQFASGPMPSAVRKNDLTPEASADEAYQLIASHTAAFLATSVLSSGPDLDKAKELLRTAYNTTKNVMEPLLKLKSLDINQANIDQWGMRAQYEISRLSNSTMQVNAELVSSYAQFMNARPSISTSSQLPQVTTYGHVTFPINPMDISTILSSPQQVAVKMKSFEAIQNAFHLANLDQGGNLTCMDINKLALMIAQQYSSDLANQRYRSRGRPIFFQQDNLSMTSSGWLTTNIEMDEDDGGLHVRSSGFKSPLDSLFHPGVHYCKLLSPYRAAEWMYVDSLRAHPM